MEKHLVQIKKVPVSYDRYGNRFVCQKCGRIFTTVPAERTCKAPKYFKVPKYKDIDG